MKKYLASLVVIAGKAYACAKKLFGLIKLLLTKVRDGLLKLVAKV